MKAKDLLGCSGGVLALFLVSAWIPFLGLLAQVLSPLPFLFYASKLGRWRGMLLIVLSLLIFGFLTSLMGYSKAILLYIPYGLSGLVLAELFRWRLSFGRTVLWAGMVIMLMGWLMLFLLGPEKKTSPRALLLSMVQEQANEAFRVIEQREPDKEKVRQIRDQIQSFIKIVEQIYPALMAMGMMLFIWINLITAKALFRLADLKYPDFGALDQWQAPEWMVWPVIAAGFASIFLDGDIRFGGVNLLLVLGCMYAFQGLMIMTFFFNKHRISAWILTGVGVLIVFQIYLLLIFSLAGLFDQWIDFRRLRRPVSRDPDQAGSR